MSFIDALNEMGKIFESPIKLDGKSFIFEPLAGKVAAGASPEHIIAKELSLGGVQRPLDPTLLGENAAEWFRFVEFAGWIITS